jgi:hypothetical protein
MLFPGNIWPCSGCTFLLGSILGIRFDFISLMYARVIDKIVKPASEIIQNRSWLRWRRYNAQFRADEVGTTLVLSLIVYLTILISYKCLK